MKSVDKALIESAVELLISLATAKALNVAYDFQDGNLHTFSQVEEVMKEIAPRIRKQLELQYKNGYNDGKWSEQFKDNKSFV